MNLRCYSDAKMANQSITMNKIKQIIKNHTSGCGTKQISSLTGVSRNTVKEYLRRFRASGLTMQEVAAMPESALADLIIGSPEPVFDQKRQAVLQPLLPSIVKAMRKRGMTSAMQWEQYYAKNPDVYKLSQFRLYLRGHLKKKNISMHFDHKAGDKAYVDYAGDHLYLTDTETGEYISVEVFVGILGCSQYTYVEASASQKKEDFISSCRRMLEYFGGSPKAIVPDNLKSAVTKGSKYAPVLNETFETFGEHYNTTILPARPHQPKDKPLVENAVKLVYQRIYTVIATQIFTTLADLNNAIWEALKDYNNRPLRGEESRLEQFEELERGALTELPYLGYEMMQTRICTVMKNSHICLAEDKHYYSIPYRFMGKRVKLLYNAHTIEVYYKYHKIASHVRDKKRHKYTTDNEHLAANQQYFANWSHEYFVAEGKKISDEVGQYLEKVMASKSHPEQGYKSCAGILHLAKKAGNDRLIQACKRASEYEGYNYPIIEEILRRNLDTIDPKNELLDEKIATPMHLNIRGKEYYS